ncbi:MAG: hypothetical protein JOY98_14765 [Candidatus Eremiobacteraeota bacterium]|nr:hypothetical protein [Candidatus Eremiobacteraeota bacterium]
MPGRFSWLLLAASLLLAFAACSGETNLTPAPRAAGDSGAALRLAKASGKKLDATIRIRVPKRRGERDRYVSPGTKSISIVIAPGGTHNFNLTPSSPGCVATSAGTICTFHLQLAPRRYTASLQTYSGVLDGLGNPTGQALSAALNAALVVAVGKSNALNVTLDGIPVNALVVPGTGSSISGGPSAFTMPKCATSPQPLIVEAFDAANYIIVGPGAPTLTMTSNNAAVAVHSPQPNSNVFTITHPISSTALGATLTVTVTPLAPSGASPLPQIPVTLTVLGGYNVCGVITEYPVPIPSVGPEGIVLDAQQNVWFTNDAPGANSIGRDSSFATFENYSTPTGGSRPYGITQGGDGQIWFTEFGANQIGAATSTGTITEYSVPTSASGPNVIAASPDGALWFTELTGNKIGRITTFGTFKEYTIPTANSAPTGIAAGPDGNLWFLECAGNKIGNISTDGLTLNEYSSGLFAPAALQNITNGPDGNMWFTELADRVGKISTTGTPITEYQLTLGSMPFGITPGYDGALWFTEPGTNKIGRITTTGTITEYPIPTAFSDVQFIYPSPDGSLWFTEYYGNKLGRIQ